MLIAPTSPTPLYPISDGGLCEWARQGCKAAMDDDWGDWAKDNLTLKEVEGKIRVNDNAGRAHALGTTTTTG
ncbi:hypothetical protein V502_10423 [Pseudogymnoascus sp. VKM F-4520 (FW-2644)]|nr:hypothetical protein V502_10423 [Pseudogymnoascus sp. VKM F-4520 (FW-2644)]